MSREKLLNGGILVLVVCSIILTGLTIRREFFSTPALGPVLPQKVENWQQVASIGNRVGAQTAPVTIIEFSDFQCPYCARMVQPLQQLQEKYRTRIAIVHRNFPIAGHAFAREAAIAAQCGAKQNAFNPFRLALFEHQREIGKKPWTEFARLASVLDTLAFAACMKDTNISTLIDEDIAVGQSIDITATPMYIINGKKSLGL